jgi:regulator of sigma E protease
MLTIVVFIHEFGHYIFARLCGVRVEAFSIGFGKELFGFTDAKQTRWKISLIPFGGYVKMFGEKEVLLEGEDSSKPMTDEEKEVSFHHKTTWQKSLIVVAGPLFNYISAALIFFYIFATNGIAFREPVLSNVVENSPAFEAGLQKGDVIVEVNSSSIESFEELSQLIAINNTNLLHLRVIRNGEELEFEVIPKMQETIDGFGEKIQMPIIGIQGTEVSHKVLSIPEAFSKSVEQTYVISVGILKALGQIFAGERDFNQLGGPIKIAQYSSKSAQAGVMTFLVFIALISINLGLLNLLPLPMLDGGHLLFFAIEGLQGKPVNEKFQLVCMKVTFALLITIMLLVTVNDIRAVLS